MGEGFDQIGKTDMMRVNQEKKKESEAKKKMNGDGDDIEAKMDEFTALIRNVVYARDPKVFDSKSGYVHQRSAFGHENFLDIKNLI